MEFSPPAQIEVLSPLVNMTDLLEKILLEFELRSGNKVVCSAQHLLAEKNTVNAYLQIENNSDCLIYQNEEDEIYNVSLLNQTNFGELKYLTGNFIRSDDGNSGGYTEVSYNPDTLLNLKVSVLKSTELK